MANVITQIRDARALGELMRAQYADGVQVALSHLGATATTLWARTPDAATAAGSENGMLLEDEFRAFRVARQTGFTGAISENGEITVSTSGLDISDNIYVVERWDSENDGAVYLVFARRKAVRRSDP